MADTADTAGTGDVSSGASVSARARLPKLRAAYAAEVLVVVGAVVAAVVATLRSGELSVDVVVGTVIALGLVALLGRAVHEVTLTPDGRLVVRAPLRRDRHLDVDDISSLRWVHARMAVLVGHPDGPVALSWRLVGLEVVMAQLIRVRPDLTVDLPAFVRRGRTPRT